MPLCALGMPKPELPDLAFGLLSSSGLESYPGPWRNAWPRLPSLAQALSLCDTQLEKDLLPPEVTDANAAQEPST